MYNNLNLKAYLEMCFIYMKYGMYFYLVEDKIMIFK